MRKVISVIAGYAIFAITSVLLFVVTSHDPHQDASMSFKLITVIYGVFFSVVSGFVLQLIAIQKKLTLNFVLAVVIFVLATVSLLTSKGDHWTQLFAMLIFAPSSILGGYLKKRLLDKR